MKPYNPLDKRNLGVSVADALLAQDKAPMDNIPAFNGAGIYAIYYSGDFPVYRWISDGHEDQRFEAPIYVGKAVPPGARKGAFGLNSDPKEALYRRLREHAESISQSENLELGDFSTRYLIVDDIWIPLGESLLIAHFSPVWNIIVDGFGNHDPGGGRYKQYRSRWDTLHPGRSWALKCQQRKESPDEITKAIELHLTTMPTPSKIIL